MGNPFLDLERKRKGGGPGSTNPFISSTTKRSGKSKSPATLEDLQEKEALLSEAARVSGAREIEQDKPGLFRNIVDVLSRPNYAVAGAAEELLNGKSVSSAVARSVNEILSGVGPFEGQKRAFGQVLEGQGVGTVTLADALPALEGTWVGNLGSRGAAGIALDIATDPLTYLTFGTSTAGRVTLSKGTTYLSKKGMQRWVEIQREFAPEIQKALSKTDLVDDVARRAELKAIDKKAKDLLESEIYDSAGKPIEGMFDEGGAKFFGKTIPKTPELRDNLRDAILSLPGGERTIQATAEFSKGLKGFMGRMFSPFGAYADAPPEVRDWGIRMHRDFTQSYATYRMRIATQARSVEDSYNKIVAKSYKGDVQALGKKFYEVKEGIRPVTELTEEEAKIFEAVSGLYDTMYKTANDVGILGDDQFRRDYFHHRYGNDSDDFLEVWAAYRGTIPSSTTPKHTRARVFDTYSDAVEVSERLEDLTTRMRQAGKVVPVYKKLKPDYDVFKNLQVYIDQHAQAVYRKAWYEEAANRFKKVIDTNLDFDAIYDLTKARDLSAAERGAIDDFLGKHKTLREADDVERQFVDAMDAGVNPHKADSIGNVLDAAEIELRKLSGDGKAELLREMFIRAKSPSQASQILERFGQKYDEFMPKARATVEGVVDPVAPHLGPYVTRSGGLWGERAIMIPKAIADDIENLNTRIINTKDYPALKKLLRGFDLVNNWFKLGVYTFWPASATRDFYSNIALSALDIGVGAVNPKTYTTAAGILAKASGEVEVGGVRYTMRQLAMLAEDLGVVVPGEAFAELTGEQGAKFGVTKLQRGIKKAARVRGTIENESRLVLWLQNIQRGLDPREAADKVSEFLFNYGEVSDFEREVMRRFIPFYTFTRKNVQLQAKAIARTPGRVINQVKPFRGREDENDMMVKFRGEALKIRLDRDGKTVRMLNGIDLPLRNIDILWRGTGAETIRQQMGMITPLLKVIPESALGRSFFTGGELDRVTSGSVGRVVEKMPGAMKDWLGYKKDVDPAGRPRYSFDGERFNLLFRSWMFSRVVSTSDRQFREYMDEGGFAWGRAVLDMMTGIRPEEVNLDEERKRRLYERIRQLENSLVKRGVYRRFSNAYKPKEQANP